MTKDFKILKTEGLEFVSIIKRLSSSGYIPAPKAFIGKKVKVTILSDEE